MARKMVKTPKRTKIHCHPASPPWPLRSDIPSAREKVSDEIQKEKKVDESATSGKNVGQSERYAHPMMLEKPERACEVRYWENERDVSRKLE